MTATITKDKVRPDMYLYTETMPLGKDLWRKMQVVLPKDRALHYAEKLGLSMPE